MGAATAWRAATVALTAINAIVYALMAGLALGSMRPCEPNNWWRLFCGAESAWPAAWTGAAAAILAGALAALAVARFRSPWTFPPAALAAYAAYLAGHASAGHGGVDLGLVADTLPFFVLPIVAAAGLWGWSVRRAQDSVVDDPP